MSSVFRGSDNFDTAGGNAIKAWVNFNGTGTVAIRASFNVSSITDNGVGDYTVNFTSALADANYAMVGSASSDASAVPFVAIHSQAAMLTTSCRIIVHTSAALVDKAAVNVAFFR